MQAHALEQSKAEWVASLPWAERAKILHAVAPTPRERAALEYAWEFWARPKQLAPAWRWQTWLILAGRGFGKTRTGAEWIREKVEEAAKTRYPLRLALVGRTAGDVRDVMVEGESGLLACSPPWNRPHYEPSKRRITWPSGARATTFSADKPDALRGPQHDGAWADELAAWRYPEAWDQLQFGLRLGVSPACCVTTTPRPTPLIKQLLDGAKGAQRTVALTRGSTYENRGNLPRVFFDRIVAKYRGTRLGRQELNAEILDDTPGALWNRALLEACRSRLDPATLLPTLPVLKRVVVAVDPSVTDPKKRKDPAEDDSKAPEGIAETGIVVAGIDARGGGHVLADLSGFYSPNEWAHVTVDAFDTWEADAVVGEVNNGGDLVESNLRTVRPKIPFKPVRASRGKFTRAEPVSALYEQHRVLHVGTFAELEDQMCTWVPGAKSPDRLDALVWALTWLMLDPEPIAKILKPRPPPASPWSDEGRGY